MKVLLVDPSLYTPPYDGALAAALAARGHEVAIAGRSPRPTDPPLGADVRVDEVFYRRGESLARWRGLARLVKGLEHAAGLEALRRLVVERRPDVVHWQWPSLPWLDARLLGVLRARAPQLVTVHDARVFKSKRGLRRLQALGWGRFLRGADAVIVHVESTRHAVRALGVDPTRISVVPHGIFARPVASPHAPASDAAAGPLRVLFFGRLSRDKGLDVLADALAALPPALHARLRATVCGPAIGEDAGVARALATLRRLPHVELAVGYVPEAELDARLAATDVVVLPHREVDASGALMKALAYEVAPLASDVPAFREVLGTAGAVYVRPGDPAALAGALADLARDPARVHAVACAAGRLREGALSWRRAAELTEAVYRRHLRGARAFAARRADEAAT